jgi:hypothetical protein
MQSRPKGWLDVGKIVDISVFVLNGVVVNVLIVVCNDVWFVVTDVVAGVLVDGFIVVINDKVVVEVAVTDVVTGVSVNGFIGLINDGIFVWNVLVTGVLVVVLNCDFNDVVVDAAAVTSVGVVLTSVVMLSVLVQQFSTVDAGTNEVVVVSAVEVDVAFEVVSVDISIELLLRCSHAKLSLLLSSKCHKAIYTNEKKMSWNFNIFFLL